MTKVITGFHAIEELLKSCGNYKSGKEAKNLDGKTALYANTSLSGKKDLHNIKESDKNGMSIFYSKIGPRAKNILQLAEELGIRAIQTDKEELDKKTQGLCHSLREHRGILLVLENGSLEKTLSFEQLLAQLKEKENALVLILDSVSDPHNAGSIVRSADQFAADAVIIPQNRSAGGSGTILKTSAGAAAWVPVVQTVNLVRAAKALKDAGFWIFGADTGGETLQHVKFPAKTAVVMGCEGSGISRLLQSSCDSIISIPTSGRIDSLNVSVAAGIILYEIRRQKA